VESKTIFTFQSGLRKISAPDKSGYKFEFSYSPGYYIVSQKSYTIHIFKIKISIEMNFFLKGVRMIILNSFIKIVRIKAIIVKNRHH